MRFELNGHTVFAGTGRQVIKDDQDWVVFVHGAGLDHTVWLVYERYFSRHGHNVLAVDLPGHGRSGGTPLASVEAIADWLSAVFDHLSMTAITIVGHSMGSLVALECAARNPTRVEKAVLLGFANPMAVGPPLLEAARNDDPAAIDMMVIYGHDFRSQLGGNRVSGVHVVNLMKRLLERNTPGVLFNDLNACNEYHDGDQAAAAVTCPVILISGDRDKMTPPRSADTAARQLSNGSLHLVRDSGHTVMAEQPELTHELLVEALSN